jgi:ketosteroid isomerase-like protein
MSNPCAQSQVFGTPKNKCIRIFPNMKAGHALTELGLKIQREHFGEFRRHGRASVWRSGGDHRQKTLYRFHDDVGNEKRFLVRKLSLAKTPRRLNVIHVTCDTPSSYVIDSKFALDFGEGHDWVFAITVRNGKLTNIREYIDTQALARASEMDASPRPRPIDTDTTQTDS